MCTTSYKRRSHSKQVDLIPPLVSKLIKYWKAHAPIFLYFWRPFLKKAKHTKAGRWARWAGEGAQGGPGRCVLQLLLSCPVGLSSRMYSPRLLVLGFLSFEDKNDHKNSGLGFFLETHLFTFGSSLLFSSCGYWESLGSSLQWLLLFRIMGSRVFGLQ